MLVRCAVPESPKTREDEYKLVAELALKGEDFETPQYFGMWDGPKKFVVKLRWASWAPCNFSLFWLSEYQQWYRVGNDTRLPTDSWDPEPITIQGRDAFTCYAHGPDELARVKLGLLMEKWNA